MLCFVGFLDSERIVGASVDTLQDCTGLKPEFLKTLVMDNFGKIKKKELALLSLGAHSLGRLGQRHFEGLTGRKLNKVLPYP